LLCQRSDRIFYLVKAVLAGSRVRALRVAAALPRLWQAGWFALVCLIAVAAAAQQPQERTYREGRYHKGELKYVNDLPVLIVEGTPTEIGEQKAVLTGDAAKVLAGYPKKLLKQLGREDQWPKVLEMGELLALNLRRDFTFVHPEVLVDKCSVADAENHLNNKVNAEQYKTYRVYAKSV